MKVIGYRTLKTALGAAAAIIIAKYVNLQYSTAAGVIVILSIQNTKRKSVLMSLERVVASILALVIASILFTVIGFYPVTFGLFLLVFIPSATRLKVAEGIVVSSVLVTHLLVEKSVQAEWWVNELSLMLIGAGIALLLNLYMPSLESRIKEDQVFIEEKMKEILRHMSNALRQRSVSVGEEELFRVLDERLELSRKRAYNNMNNYLLINSSYYTEYMEMRIQQVATLKRMRSHFQRFSITYDQTIMMADFTEEVANSFHERNTAEGLLIRLGSLRDNYKAAELPQSREEFENRAMLYQFLNDMEEFLEIKLRFSKRFKLGEGVV